MPNCTTNLRSHISAEFDTWCTFAHCMTLSHLSAPHYGKQASCALQVKCKRFAYLVAYQVDKLVRRLRIAQPCTCPITSVQLCQIQGEL